MSMEITHSQAYSYRVPEVAKKKSRPQNVIVRITATTSDGREVEGLGEGQPRGWRTGEDAGDSWAFLTAATGALTGRSLALGDRSQALQSVREVMAELAVTAQELSRTTGHRRPFRGTMVGLEVALLDAVARARGERLAQLLGQKREEAPVAPGALSPDLSMEKLRKKLISQGSAFEFVRLTAGDDIASTVDFMETVSLVNRSRQVGCPDKPLWVDLNGALTRPESLQLLDAVAESVEARVLPPQVILEQPVPTKYRDHLGTLHQRTRTFKEESTCPDAEIRVIGDESVADIHHVSRLRKVGGLAGVTIRPAQAGGLLASLDLAERVLREEPEARIFLARMVGASRVTSAALRHLALALPRIDAAIVQNVVEDDLPITRRLTPADAVPAPAPPLAAGGTTNGVVEMIPHDDDEEPATDDREPEDDLVDDEASASGTTDDDPQDHQDVDRERETTEDVAESSGQSSDQRSAVKTSRVRDVPGLGVDLVLSELVAHLQNAVTYPVPPAETYDGVPVTRYDDVDDLHPLGPNGSKGHLLEREALALGLNTTRYSKGAFDAWDGQKDPVPFKWSRNPLSSAASLALCTHKEATRMQLQQAGVPVPQGRTFAVGDFDTAREFVARIGFPVVVKPAMGVRGIGVVAGIQNEEQLDAAFSIMSGSKLGQQDFIVEKHVHGADYRIVVVGEEVIAAIRREPASVTGDGTSTIAELLINKNIARRRNPHLWARPAKFDEAAHHELEKAGRDLDTVLPEGERQLLANTCSLSQGGDSIDVLDEMHPSIKEASVQAVQAMPGLQFCGVDFLLEDHTRPLQDQDAGICELNAHAAIGNCEYPMFGTGRPVAQTLMRAVVDQHGLNARADRAERLALHLTIRGRVTRVNFRAWLKRRAESAGVTGWVRNVDSRTVEAVLVGPTDPTTAVAAATILGPKRAVPTAYEARHISAPQELSGFEIREDAPAGTRVEVIDAS
ncbi:hypothetical protein GCM10027061_28060 [Nesterenkonia suensis]